MLVMSSSLSDVQSAVDSQGFKKNTAFANFEFPMASNVTAKTGLTVTATRSIDGGAFGACANAVAEVSGGIYKIALAAADLNGDFVTLRFASAGADATEFGVKTRS